MLYMIQNMSVATYVAVQLATLLSSVAITAVVQLTSQFRDSAGRDSEGSREADEPGDGTDCEDCEDCEKNHGVWSVWMVSNGGQSVQAGLNLDHNEGGT